MSQRSGVARIWCEGAQNYTKIVVARKMTRNNTLNEVRVAATELPQLLSLNTKRQPAKSLSDFVQL